MPAFRFAVSVSLATSLLLIAGNVAAQPTLPRDQAPAVSESIRPLVDRLYSADPHVRAEAACQLGRRQTRSVLAVPILLTMLGDDVTVAAIECHMSPWLRREIAKNPDARKWSETSPAKEAAEALGDIGEPAVPGLLQALGHNNWKVRKFAAYGLGEADPVDERAKVVAALGERLKDPHPEVRERSAWALGEIDDPTAIGTLIKAMSDADAAVRRQVAWALGEIRDLRAVEALTRALKDIDWQVRKTVAWALGEIADSRAIEQLRDAAADVNHEVRRAIEQALRELRHKHKH